MSLGRSKEEQELTTRLAQGLVVKEVLEPMSKIGWGHGTPPPADYTSTPTGGLPTEGGAPGPAAAPATVAPAGQPAPKPAASPAQPDPSKADTPSDLDAYMESLRDDKGLILGKYKTSREAIKGVGHAVSMAKQAFTERDNALMRLGAISANQLRNPAAAPAAVPQAQTAQAPTRGRLEQAKAKLESVLSGITENGGVLDADSAKSLTQAQYDLSEAMADFRVQEDRVNRETAANAERNEWDSVDEHMLKNYPESALFVEETSLHLQGNPLLNSAVQALLAQGKRLEATELAWRDFSKSHTEQIVAETQAKAEEKEVELDARGQVRKEKLEEARKDAGVVHGSAGGAGVHERNAAGNSREEIDAAIQAMRREGESPGSPAAMRFRQMVIGPSLDPAIFGPLR